MDKKVPNKEVKSIIQLKVISNKGPKVQHHASWILDGYMYVHGGLANNTDKLPSNELLKFNMETGWEKVNAINSPHLSHHCAVVQDSCVLLIGGWNGTNRISGIYVYEPENLKFKKCITSGFPNGGGLSSHTCTLLENGQILIFGREGSMRHQRKYGNCFIVDADQKSSRFMYNTVNLDTASRSGHTTLAVKDKVIIIGGRKDKVIEMHSFKTHVDSINNYNKEAEMILNLSSLKKEPHGRRNAVCFKLNESLCLIHGGETFENPVDDILCFDFSLNKWYKIGMTGICLKGHSVNHLNNSIIIHGGLSINEVVSNATYELITI